MLGLGTQVKGHNERRFSVPWSAPVPRLREYVESLRAIWRCWEKREPLRYEGEHYRFTLMTPEFSPPPSGLPPIPVSIAAVGPDMLKLAGRVCDGVRLHGFAHAQVPRGGRRSRRSKRASRRAAARARTSRSGAAASSRPAPTTRRSRSSSSSAATGSPSTARRAATTACFAVHGWEDLGDELHAMSKRGQWNEMAKQVPDEVVRTFAAVGRYDEIAGRSRSASAASPTP